MKPSVRHPGAPSRRGAGKSFMICPGALDARSPATTRWTHSLHMTTRTAEPLSLDQLRKQLRERWRSLFQEADPTALGGCSARHWASRSLHATRLPGLALERVYLDDSLIPCAGRGVFASADCLAGSLLTLYPGDAIRIDDILAGYNHVSCCSASDDGSLCITDASLLNRARTYEIEVSTPHHGAPQRPADTSEPSLSSVLGDPDRVDDPAYLGHMLNDGAICTSEALRPTYTSESSSARNAEPVQLEGCHLAIVATRDVRRGEELLLTYGAAYWLAQTNGARSAGEVRADGATGEWEGGVSQRRRHGRQSRREPEGEWSSAARKPRQRQAQRRRAARRGSFADVDDDMDWS